MNKESEMSNHVILGPNLLDQSKGELHVHREGCADIKRTKGLGCPVDTDWVVDVETEQEVVEIVYDDQIRESKGDWKNYKSEFFFAPCCELK